MSGGRCDRPGCGQPATHAIRARFWPKGWPKTSEAHLDLGFAVAVCAEHALGLTVEAALSDEAWRSIAQSFAEAGRAEPDRESMEVYAAELKSAANE
jgi:hypothetical protein